MGLPPSSLGTRAPTVRLERVGEQQWRVRIDGRPLSGIFISEGEARSAGAAELERLDAVALALLRRVRSSLNRKRR